MSLIPVVEPWILLIMLSVGPFSGQYEGENNVWYHVRMHSQTECLQAAQNLRTTHRIFQHLNPNLHMDVICREDLRYVPYVDECTEANPCPEDSAGEAPEPGRINYRECLDMFKP